MATLLSIRVDVDAAGPAWPWWPPAQSLPRLVVALGFGGNQWVRYVRSIFGSPDLENRSGRRSLVQLT
jgi:hypothetical protein